MGISRALPSGLSEVWFAQLYQFSVVRSDRRVNELAGVDLHDRRRPFFVICPLFRLLERPRPTARPTLSVSGQKVSRAGPHHSVRPLRTQTLPTLESL